MVAMAKTASNQPRICLRIIHVRRVYPKVSKFLAGTTKILTKKTQNGWKWQYFGQNSAIMAGSWHERYFLSMSMGNYVLCQRWLLPDTQDGQYPQIFRSFMVNVKGASPFVDTFCVNLVGSIWKKSLGLMCLW